MRRSAPRWIAAVLLAGLAPAQLFAAIAFDGRIRVGHATGTAFGLAFALALAQVLVLGVPVTAWLRRRGRFTAVRMLAAGFVAGVAPCALLLLWQSRGAPAALLDPALAAIVLVAGGFGMLSALVMWGVLRGGLPAPHARGG